MAQTFDEFWKFLLDNHRPYCYNPKKSAQMAWNAALNTIELANTSTNKQSTPCQCGNQSVAHFCRNCLDAHVQYCKIPF
jgi:hypothetical protein